MNRQESIKPGWSFNIEDTRHAVVFLFCLAILVRLVYWIGFYTNPYTCVIEPSQDSTMVQEGALCFAGGDWLMNSPNVRFPLYSCLVGIIYALAGTSLQYVWMVQFTAGAVCTVLVYLIAIHFFTHRQGMIAGCLYAIYPQNLFYEGSLLRDVLAGFLVVASAYSFVRLEKRQSLTNIVLCGVVTSLAIQARANLLVLLPLLVVYLWFVVPGATSVRARLARTGMFLFVVVLIAMPLLLRGIRVEGRFMLFDPSGPSVLLLGNLTDYSGVGWEGGSPRFREYLRNDPDAVWRNYPHVLGLIWRDVVSHPVGFIALYLRKAYYFFTNCEIADNSNFYLYQRFSPLLRNPIGSFTALSLLGLLGAMVSFRREKRPWLLYVFLLGTMVSTLIFYNVSRFRIPTYPFFIILAACAIAWLAELIRRRIVPGVAVICALSLVAWLLNIPHIQKIRANDLAMLGHAHSVRREYAKAIECYQEVLAMVPNYRTARYNLACAFCMTGNFDAGIQQFQEILSREPDDMALHIDLALAYLCAGKTEEARQHASAARAAALTLPARLAVLLDADQPQR